MKIRQLPALALFIAATAVSIAQAEPVTRSANGVLVNASGMTLYTFDKDVAGSGKSACNGPCIALWPALAATAGAQPEGDFSLVARDDGSAQWAYKGKPLYTYAADKKAGDVTGDNVKDVWHIAK